jgi:transcription termination factor Rho
MNEGGASVPEVSAQPVPGENEEAPKPKRRRTTRRKKDAEDASAVANVSAESAEQAEKPVRRRRTRKKAAEAESAEAPAAEAPKAEAAAEEAPKPQRRRRTRKQASAEAAPAEPAPSETAPQEPAVHAEHESAEVPAEHEQRREHEGRAERAEEAAPAAEEQEHEAEPAAESSSEQQEGSASEHEHEHEERGRGRRRQNRRFERNGSEHQGGQNGERQEHGRFNQRNDRFNQRNNRQNGQNRRRNNRRQEVPEPSLTRDELKEMKVAELRSKAAELGVEYVGLRKADLVESIFEAAAKAEGFRPVTGILEIQPEGYGFIRTGNYMQGDDDAFVFQQMIKQNGLRTGDEVSGTVGPNRNNSKFPPLISIDTVDGMTVEELRRRPRFRDLTPIYPNECLKMEHGKDSITGRAIDIVSPIGKGQRGLIVSPPKAGKTTVLKKVCESIAANNPEVHLICLLVDERPEEVTDMQRSIKGEVVASTFDMPASNHTAVSELVIERAKRLVELGQDVVVVLDSITRLARAYNLAMPASGRILSGGVDSAALYPPKKFLGAARNIENGGSLTILASALVDTGSKMDEVIFEEFKGTGNMELKLDRELADKRIFPAIDPVASGTRNEELLIDPELQPFVWGIRRILANMNNTERAEMALVKSLKATSSNEEFLIRSAKKAAQSEYVDAL